MFKKLIITTLVLVASANLQAQHAAGRSADVHSDTTGSFRYYTDSINVMRLSLARTSGFYLSSAVPDRMATASLNYLRRQGSYMRAQDAGTVNAVSFSTEGSVKIGKTRLLGHLNYEKAFEDSTRFAHQTRRNPSVPYYFGSPAPVHYERSVYSFKAQVARPFWQDRMEFALGLDYRLGDHFSTNDPRGSVGEHQLDIQLALGVKLTSRFKLGLSYQPGYGQERFSVGYRNRRNIDSQTYPMYYNHLVNGYAESTARLNDRKYNNNFRRQTFAIYADLDAGLAGQFSLNARYRPETQKFFDLSESGRLDYGSYNLDEYGATLLWTKALSSGAIGLELNYRAWEGRDVHGIYLANNYVYLASHASGKLFFRQQAGKNVFQHSVSIAGRMEERVDGISGNDLLYGNTSISAGSSMQAGLPKNRKLGLALAGTAVLPGASRFVVSPVNVSYFTPYVIYHDYLFNTATAAGLNLRAAYAFPAFTTMHMSVESGLNYLRKLDEETIDRTLLSSPGNDRFDFNVRLNLYF